jgi:hypothetical protein
MNIDGRIVIVYRSGEGGLHSSNSFVYIADAAFIGEVKVYPAEPVGCVVKGILPGSCSTIKVANSWIP